jgi:hypothetical protein
MAVLIMVVCLGASQCHEERVLFRSGQSCATQAAIVVAEWQLAHDRWVVQSWECASMDDDNQG